MIPTLTTLQNFGSGASDTRESVCCTVAAVATTAQECTGLVLGEAQVPSQPLSSSDGCRRCWLPEIDTLDLIQKLYRPLLPKTPPWTSVLAKPWSKEGPRAREPGASDLTPAPSGEPA